MDGWDTEAISTGEWWVLLIAVAMLLAGVAAGYVMGRNQAREEFRHGNIPPLPPAPTGGPLS